MILPTNPDQPDQTNPDQPRRNIVRALPAAHIVSIKNRDTFCKTPRAVAGSMTVESNSFHNGRLESRDAQMPRLTALTALYVGWQEGR